MVAKTKKEQLKNIQNLANELEEIAVSGESKPVEKKTVKAKSKTLKKGDENLILKTVRLTTVQVKFLEGEAIKQMKKTGKKVDFAQVLRSYLDKGINS